MLLYIFYETSSSDHVIKNDIYLPLEEQLKETRAALKTLEQEYDVLQLRYNALLETNLQYINSDTPSTIADIENHCDSVNQQLAQKNINNYSMDDKITLEQQLSAMQLSTYYDLQYLIEEVENDASWSDARQTRFRTIWTSLPEPLVKLVGSKLFDLVSWDDPKL